MDPWCSKGKLDHLGPGAAGNNLETNSAKAEQSMSFVRLGSVMMDLEGKKRHQITYLLLTFQGLGSTIRVCNVAEVATLLK